MLDDAARRWLAEHGYDPKMGARPMARLIQEQIKRPLADELLFGKLAAGGTVKIGVSSDGRADAERCRPQPALTCWQKAAGARARCCMVLAADWQRIEMLEELAGRGLFRIRAVGKYDRGWDEFCRLLLRLASARTMPGMPKLPFH